MAHLGAVEQQDGDLNAVAALQLRIGVDIHDIHRRQGKGAPSFCRSASISSHRPQPSRWTSVRRDIADAGEQPSATGSRP